ncbi:MAG TPA: hypothetical protein DCM31_02670 [Deferribacteraceae bacterium]|nr:hypothetical protein [Deferribacteraceae bacterium]
MRISLGLLCLLIPLHILLSGAFIANKADFDSKFERDIAVSGRLLRFTSLEFKGLAADSRLLSAIFYVGKMLQDRGIIKGQDWDWFEANVKSSSELDPYFYDTYYFASLTLAWSANRPEAAVKILEKGIEKRPESHRLLFNLGFIYYYFLKDSAKASEYIGQAAKIKGAPPFYANLAARLAYDSGRHETAAAFLLDMLNHTGNENVRAMYEKRLIALQRAIELEKAVRIYKEKYFTTPSGVDELKAKGVITVAPVDPYGGEYFINEKGRVYSTSGFAEKKQ